jgi:hypothetical protein
MDGQLGAEIEEELGYQTFSFRRLRLAYQRALDSPMSSNHKRLKAMSVIAMVVATGIIFLYIWCYSLFEPRAHKMDRQALRNKFR